MHCIITARMYNMTAGGLQQCGPADGPAWSEWLTSQGTVMLEVSCMYIRAGRGYLLSIHWLFQLQQLLLRDC